MKTNDYKVVGTRPARQDGVDKVTGRALFGADFHISGLLHGCVLRSPHAHARIRSIDVSKAVAFEGVKAVVTADDMPEGPDRVINYGEGPMRVSHLRGNMLASGKVLYKGHGIAAVAAVSPHVAEEAAGLIEVDYEVLPCVLTVEDAMLDDAPILHEDLQTIELGAETGGVRGAASLGETIRRSTPALVNSSIWARCLSESFCASLKITRTPPAASAALFTSAFICTRQGSPRLHWLIPMVHLGRPEPGASRAPEGVAAFLSHPPTMTAMTGRSPTHSSVRTSFLVTSAPLRVDQTPHGIRHRGHRDHRDRTTREATTHGRAVSLCVLCELCGPFDYLRVFWKRTAPMMMLPVSISRLASPTALILRIFSR